MVPPSLYLRVRRTILYQLSDSLHRFSFRYMSQTPGAIQALTPAGAFASRMRDLGDHWRRGAAGRRKRRPAAAILQESLMESRTTSKLVTFHKPFTLLGLDGIQPPGTYAIRTEEEMLDTLSFACWRQTVCTILLHRDGGVEYAVIDPQELREALVRDGDQGSDPPASPSVAMSRDRRARDQLRWGGRQ